MYENSNSFLMRACVFFFFLKLLSFPDMSRKKKAYIGRFANKNEKQQT